MRVCVLGHRGMLGHVVARFLKDRKHEIVTVENRFSEENPAAFIDQIIALRPVWCINCIGLRATASSARRELFSVNALLPQLCAEALSGKSRFMHASTDGVFRPDRANRYLTDDTDATDDYGRAKRSAEISVLDAGGTVIRCSIVGPELSEPRSLFGWLLRSIGEVDGYTNQLWNGITTLQWAKIGDDVISGQIDQGPIIQPGIWPALSKYHVLNLVAKVWGSAVKIRPAEANNPVIRSLIPSLQCPDLSRQLNELKLWYAPGRNRS